MKKWKEKEWLGKYHINQLHKIKKTEHIILNNRDKKTKNNNEIKNIKDSQTEHKTNILANAGASLIVQKYNARPVRCEGPSKISLSPLLINLPMTDN